MNAGGGEIFAKGTKGRAQESESSFKTAVKASLGRVTLPSLRIFFLPAFCFSSSFFLRLMSPPYHLASTSLRMALTVSRAMILPPTAAWTGISNSARGMFSLSFSQMRRPLA